MKRRIVKLCVFVLALLSGGAIINVAVAWGCALFAGEQASLPNRIWVFEYPKPIIDLGYADGRMSYSTIGWTLETLEQPYQVYGPYRQPSRILTGWPARSLGYLLIASRTPSVNPIRVGINTGLQLGSNFPHHHFQRNLPLFPIWPGFAINTIFYAGILWLLFAAPGFIRRRVRRKRGLCLACAYPIGSNEVCTECGRPLTPRSR